MANELSASYTTGSVLYAVILNASGQAYNTATPAFEAINGANWANYAINFAEQGTTGLFLASVPAGISAAGRYSVKVYLRAGGSPALGDSFLGASALEWTGTAESNNNAIADAILKRDWTAMVGVVPARSMLNALRWLRNKWTLPKTGPLTVYAEDDTTAAWTRTVTEDSTAPPVTGVN
jgi:hypothetical protein